MEIRVKPQVRKIIRYVPKDSMKVEDYRILKARGQVKHVQLKSPALTMGYNLMNQVSGRHWFEDCPYDLIQIQRAMDTEAYMARAFDKHISQIFKNGIKIWSKNTKAGEYIKRRLRQIAKVTNYPTNLFLKEIAEQLIPYSNVFIVKVRNEKASGGRRRRDINGKELIPIAGYFILDAPNIKIQRANKKNQVKKYREYNFETGDYKDYSADDIIHIYFNRKQGQAFGTPYSWPVLDDIRALRRLEEGIEMLVYQNLFPLYHYQVGTDKIPDDPGGKEVDSARMEVEGMAPEGMLVTSYRHKITAVGAEGRALRAEGYLEHFKKRVFAGLGMSGVEFGEGETANRSTADAVVAEREDRVRDFQKVIKMFTEEFIFKELLAEGEFDIDDPENHVFFDFVDINLDEEIKKNNHATELFQSNAITHEEYRQMIGKDPMTDEEWMKTYYNLIQRPIAILGAVDEPGTPAAQEMSKAAANRMNAQAKAAKKGRENSSGVQNFPGKLTPQTAGKGAPGAKGGGKPSTARTKNAPVNQYGRKTSPKKSLKDFQIKAIEKSNIKSEIKDEILKLLENNDEMISDSYVTDGPKIQKYSLAIPEMQQKLSRYYEDIKADTLNIVAAAYEKNINIKDKELVSLVYAGSKSMKSNLAPYLTRVFNSGIEHAKEWSQKSVKFNSRPYISEVIDKMEEDIERFFISYKDKVLKSFSENKDKENSISKVSATLDTLNYRTDFIVRTLAAKAFNYALLRYFQAAGISESDFVIDSDCEICKDKAETLSINNMDLDSVPPWHPNSTTTILPKKEDK